MIIAKNDEMKRSKIWRIVTLVSSILIVVIAIYLLTKMFTTNPLEGTWEDEDGNMTLTVKGNGKVIVNILEIAEETNVEVELPYTINKEEKTVTIQEDDETLQKMAEESQGLYTEETLRTALGMVMTTFDYSVDRQTLTLTEREYGEQMIFRKK